MFFEFIWGVWFVLVWGMAWFTRSGLSTSVVSTTPPVWQSTGQMSPSLASPAVSPRTLSLSLSLCLLLLTHAASLFHYLTLLFSPGFGTENSTTDFYIFHTNKYSKLNSLRAKHIDFLLTSVKSSKNLCCIEAQIQDCKLVSLLIVLK